MEFRQLRPVGDLVNGLGTPIADGSVTGRRCFGRIAAVAVLLAAGLPFVTASADPMPAPALLPTPAPHIGFAGGDGSTCRGAVVITGASRESEGIRAERWWVFSKNPGAKVVGQRVSSETGRDLETFDVLVEDGSHKAICFDITSFYGKP